MCTTISTTVPVSGAAKGGQGWFPVTAAVVGFDHATGSAADHAVLNRGLLGVLDVHGLRAGVGGADLQLHTELGPLLGDEFERLLRQRLRTGDEHAELQPHAVLGAEAVPAGAGHGDRHRQVLRRGSGRRVVASEGMILPAGGS